MKWFSVWCRRFTFDFGSLLFPVEKSSELPHPLAPLDDNSVAEPEPEVEAEPSSDHSDHDHDHDHHAEPEPSSTAHIFSIGVATVASAILALIAM